MSVILSLAQNVPTPPTGPSMDTLFAVTEKLTALIEHEISILSADTQRDISEFQDEKNRLSGIYAREMALVRACPDQVAAWPRESIDRLKQMTIDFNEALKRHKLTLDRVKSVTETVLKSIGKHVAERTRPVIGYGKNAANTYANAKAPVSLAFDRAI